MKTRRGDFLSFSIGVVVRFTPETIRPLFTLVSRKRRCYDLIVQHRYLRPELPVQVLVASLLKHGQVRKG